MRPTAEQLSAYIKFARDLREKNRKSIRRWHEIRRAMRVYGRYTVVTR
jgi:hypothetical protein